jgi:hypothetical protein
MGFVTLADRYLAQKSPIVITGWISPEAIERQLVAR